MHKNIILFVTLNFLVFFSPVTYSQDKGVSDAQVGNIKADSAAKEVKKEKNNQVSGQTEKGKETEKVNEAEKAKESEKNKETETSKETETKKETEAVQETEEESEVSKTPEEESFEAYDNSTLSNSENYKDTRDVWNNDGGYRDK